jgi:hypothetical protein
MKNKGGLDVTPIASATELARLATPKLTQPQSEILRATRTMTSTASMLTNMARQMQLHSAFVRNPTLSGLDGIRRAVDALKVKTSLDSLAQPFVAQRALINGMYGAEAALRFDRSAARSLMPSLDALLRSTRPATVFDASGEGDIAGSLTWLEPSADGDTDPIVRVATLHTLKPADDAGVWRRLEIDPGSALICPHCREALDINYFDLYLVTDGKASFTGEATCRRCTACTEHDADDDGYDPEYEIYRGELAEGEEDTVPESGRYRMVRKSPESDE